MDPNLREAHLHMRQLGLGALRHANWHANTSSMENPYWAELSVLQAAHAAEILIKARIAQEHHLLIFKDLPKNSGDSAFLSGEQLIERAQTYQYSELPHRLWATTGIRIPNLEIYSAFGRLRNSIQHYAAPTALNPYTSDFIFEVIDPFINQCWGLFAVDYTDDTAPYEYLVANLIRNGVKFLVSPGLVDDWQYVETEWPDDDPDYKTEMERRISEAARH